MCGIFGIIAQNGRIPAGMLERGTESLAHRGPDDSGTVVLQDSVPGPVEIGLGNRRLAILDLSPLAHQPMHDAETGNWIVYNGEIYNFHDVRNELEQAGTSFVSHSDTEVLLKAYARWSEQCLAKFRGMFAFALWDAPRHRVGAVAHRPCRPHQLPDFRLGLRPAHSGGRSPRASARQHSNVGRWS